MSVISLESVTLKLDGAPILRDVSTKLRKGEFVALVGPNGAGKSSLMKCALGAIAPTKGRAKIGDADAATMDPITRARMIAYLPQIRPAAWPVVVEDIVALGRYAYGGSSSRARGDVDDAVAAAISSCGLDNLLGRRTDTLSGGELARVHCARAFAANAPFLLADEVTNSLDPAGQIDVMTLIREQVDAGVGALAILHDINLAATFVDRIIWMKAGRILADGPPSDTISAERLRDIFAVNAQVSDVNGARFVTYKK